MNRGNCVVKIGVILMLCMLLAGCQQADKAGSSSISKEGLSYEGELLFSGLDHEFSVVYNDIYAMESVTRDVKHLSSSGEESVDKVTGVILDTILSEKGISQKDFSVIRFIAGDGYAIDVTSEILQEKDIILAYAYNGTYLDEKKQPLRVAIDGVRSMYFVANLNEIVFVKKNDTSLPSNTMDPKKVIILETAAEQLQSDIYTYYDSEDQAFKVADLLNAYAKEDVDLGHFMASDGFEKSEDMDVLMKGYIKTTGKDIPLFTVPDLPKGMHVKHIFTLKIGDTLFASASQGIGLLEQRTMSGKVGTSLDIFMDKVGLTGEDYVFTSGDGYQVEISKNHLNRGIIYLDDSGQYGVMFDKSLPKSTGVKGILSIEVSDDANGVDRAVKDDTKKNETSSDNQEIPWTITVEGLSDGSFELTKDRAERKLERAQLHTERVKDDKKNEEDWEGYRVLDVLYFLKVEDFNTLVIIAKDGFEIELSKEDVDEETLLAVAKNEVPLIDPDNLVQLVQNTTYASTWVKGVSKIIVK
ncbi:molybdopterin-dependent oxidoreductase [Vallitalea pronyensis]|uniref:Molybdopterin-dependent oxidoreductase n=1 Tax=Vallitalea pronyensis TaxID=1348613 RepID=A0A8J8MJC0_9FIRM|nr:molybdopterin-dependent oxidoreductase [Vallitalea pronyensis]QUI22338.1 molybdopterin-dependent oxidoreductase [Vallitalea pronyensis]